MARVIYVEEREREHTPPYPPECLHIDNITTVHDEVTIKCDSLEDVKSVHEWLVKLLCLPGTKKEESDKGE